MCCFHRAVFMAILIGFIGVLFGPAGAQEPTPAVDPASEPRETTPDPMMTEILGLLESEKTELAILQEDFTTAADEHAAVEAMRRISELKKGTEVGILRIQLKYAKLAGSTEAVAKIELAIEKMMNPRPQGTPQPRPRPPEN